MLGIRNYHPKTQLVLSVGACLFWLGLTIFLSMSIAGIPIAGYTFALSGIALVDFLILLGLTDISLFLTLNCIPNRAIDFCLESWQWGVKRISSGLRNYIIPIWRGIKDYFLDYQFWREFKAFIIKFWREFKVSIPAFYQFCKHEISISTTNEYVSMQERRRLIRECTEYGVYERAYTIGEIFERQSSAEKFKNIFVRKPMIIVENLFKVLFSNLLGFQWVLDLRERFNTKVLESPVRVRSGYIYSRPIDPTSIELPSWGFTESGFEFGIKRYGVSWWNPPFICLNYIMRNVGKIVGWLLVFWWTLPAFAIITGVYKFKLYRELGVYTGEEVALDFISHLNDSSTNDGSWNINELKKSYFNRHELYLSFRNYIKYGEVSPLLLKTIYLHLMKEQIYQKRLWKIGMFLCAIFFTPLSLFIIFPIYKQKIEENEIIKMEITEDEYNQKDRDHKVISYRDNLTNNKKGSSRKIYLHLNKDSHNKEDKFYQYSTRDQYDKKIIKGEIRKILPGALGFNASKSNKVFESFSMEILSKMESIYDKFSRMKIWNTKSTLIKFFMVAIIECAFRCGEAYKALFYIGKLDFDILTAAEINKITILLHHITMHLSEIGQLQNETLEQKNDRIINVIAILSIIPDRHAQDYIQTLKMNLCTEVLSMRSLNLANQDALKNHVEWPKLEKTIHLRKQGYLSILSIETNIEQLKSLVSTAALVSPWYAILQQQYAPVGGNFNVNSAYNWTTSSSTL